jgi:hypothetical protein
MTVDVGAVHGYGQHYAQKNFGSDGQQHILPDGTIQEPAGAGAPGADLYGNQPHHSPDGQALNHPSAEPFLTAPGAPHPMDHLPSIADQTSKQSVELRGLAAAARKFA